MGTSFGHTTGGFKSTQERIRLPFRVSAGDPDVDAQLYNIAVADKVMIEAQIEKVLREEMPSLELERLDIRKGSVEFWITLAATYEFISHYEDFERSLDRIGQRIVEILRVVFGSFGDIGIQAGDMEGDFKKLKKRLTPKSPQDNTLFLLIAYLVLSHAALLAFVLRMLYMKMK